jgi:hypothetical protein
MSLITEAVVLGATDAQMVSLNRELAALDEARRQTFGRISEDGLMDRAGGTKFFCETLWAAAFNYLPESVIEEAALRAWGGPVYGAAIITQAEEGDWRMLLAPQPDS